MVCEYHLNIPKDVIMAPTSQKVQIVVKPSQHLPGALASESAGKPRDEQEQKVQQPVKQSCWKFELTPRWWQLKYFWNFHLENWGR